MKLGRCPGKGSTSLNCLKDLQLVKRVTQGVWQIWTRLVKGGSSYSVNGKSLISAPGVRLLFVVRRM